MKPTQQIFCPSRIGDPSTVTLRTVYRGVHPLFTRGGRAMTTECSSPVRRRLSPAGYRAYAESRIVHGTSTERHALAVAYIYEHYGRVAIGRGRMVWAAGNFPRVRMEELVRTVAGDLSEPEPLPRPAYHRPETDGDAASDAELIADMLAGETGDDWNLVIAASIAVAQSAELQEESND